METAAFTQFTADHDFAGATHYLPTPFGLRPVRELHRAELTAPCGPCWISTIQDDMNAPERVRTAVLIPRQ